MKITPFTSDGGLKGHPQLSPDGERVAYWWGGPEDENWDLYVKGLGLGATPFRLVDSPEDEDLPVWSPDGRQIAFVRWTGFGGEGASIYTVPSLGGQVRKLVDIAGPVVANGTFILDLSWSPDGEWLAYSEKYPVDEPAHIVRLSLDTLRKETLTSPPAGSLGDLRPRFSPDGTEVAFVRAATSVLGNEDVWVQSVGGEARRLTSKGYVGCYGLAWTEAGDAVVFTGEDQILRVDRRGGEPRPIAGIGQHTGSPTIRGHRMAYVQGQPQPHDILRLPGVHSPPSGRTPEKLISSAGGESLPAYSPDGQKIAFMSNRSGVANVWVCDSDGSNPVQLTDLGNAGSPNWSPDGHLLAFDSRDGGDFNVYVISADGGIPRRLTPEASDETRPFWSPDGRWIYFASGRSGRDEIWKMPADGGEPIQLTRDGGAWPQVSADGTTIYYSKALGASAIWRVSPEGGDEAEVFAGPVWTWNWAVGRSGLYLSRYEPLVRGTRWAIEHLDPETGRVTELFRKDGPFDHTTVAVSPDEEWILYGEQPVGTSELMLVENFH